MKFRLRLLAAVLAIFAVLAGAASAQELGLASDVWPPFTDQAGRARVAVDLVQEALARAGVRATFSIVEFDKVIQGLGLGNYDGSAALWKDAEREQYLFFSAPYLENRLVLVGRKGADVGADSFTQLAGKKIAVVAGYSYGNDVEGDVAPTYVEGRDDQENLTRLLAGEVDYMLVDELLIRHVARNQRAETEAKLAIGSHALIVRPLHFALSRGLPGAEATIARFDEAVAAMVADGTFNRILGLNWIRADVDGDGKMELIGSGDAVGPEGPELGYDLAAGEGGDDSSRFLIEGQMYETWEDVPEKYKYKTHKDHVQDDPGATLYQLQF